MLACTFLTPAKIWLGRQRSGVVGFQLLIETFSKIRALIGTAYLKAEFHNKGLNRHCSLKSRIPHLASSSSCSMTLLLLKAFDLFRLTNKYCILMLNYYRSLMPNNRSNLKFKDFLHHLIKIDLYL